MVFEVIERCFLIVSFFNVLNVIDSFVFYLKKKGSREQK